LLHRSASNLDGGSKAAGERLVRIQKTTGRGERSVIQITKSRWIFTELDLLVVDKKMVWVHNPAY